MRELSEGLATVQCIVRVQYGAENFMNELDSSRTNLSPNYFKYTCGSFTRYLYIDAGFTSIGLDNDDDCGYQLD